MEHERHYTVEQANAALEWVAERLARLRDALEVLQLDESRQALERAREEPGGGYPNRVVVEALLELFISSAELQSVDVVVRDAERGLVDFPSIRDGNEVYLCWQIGEGSVSHWHDPGSGFAGREPL